MSDNDLFSSDSEFDKIEEVETFFWEKININKYHINLDLQKAMFLIDLLEDLYEFKLKDNEIIIYEKKDSGIKEIIDREKLIYFLQINLPNMFKEAGYDLRSNSGRNLYNYFVSSFKEIKTINLAIDNMKIYLKYNKEEEIEEEEEEIELLKEVKTKKYKIKNKIDKNFKLLKPTVL